MNRKWLQFWLLCLIWGSSFLFIRIGVEYVPPLQLVFIRTLIAALGLNMVLWWQKKSFPGRGRNLVDIMFLGVVNTVMPFFLITWGETHIEVAWPVFYKVRLHCLRLSWHIFPLPMNALRCANYLVLLLGFWVLSSLLVKVCHQNIRR